MSTKNEHSSKGVRCCSLQRAMDKWPKVLSSNLGSADDSWLIPNLLITLRFDFIN
jgi:hypothetical protein